MEKNFFEHGSLGHEQTLYRELLHVPLIFKLPGADSMFINKAIKMPVSIIDIMPTILGVLGIRQPDDIDGEDILSDNKMTGGLKRKCLFSERVVVKSIIDKNWKYIYHYCTQYEQLFDLVQDPEESNNLAHIKTSHTNKLKRRLLNWVSASMKSSHLIKIVQFDKDQEEKLKSLGYIQDKKDKLLNTPSWSCSVEVCH